MATMTVADVQVRSDRAQGRQIRYDQNSSDGHGQVSGSWRSDCSGLTCAVFGIGNGLGCPSTFELVHGEIMSDPINRADVVPFQTCTIVTNEDGHPFGHVAIVVGYDRDNDRLRIQEHGGGIGPDIRWLPAGLNYDSDARYGVHRNFQLRNVLSVGVTPPADNAPTSQPTTSKDDDSMAQADIDAINAHTDKQLAAVQAQLSAVVKDAAAKQLVWDGQIAPTINHVVIGLGQVLGAQAAQAAALRTFAASVKTALAAHK